MGSKHWRTLGVLTAITVGLAGCTNAPQQRDKGVLGATNGLPPNGKSQTGALEKFPIKQDNNGLTNYPQKAPTLPPFDPNANANMPNRNVNPQFQVPNANLTNTNMPGPLPIDKTFAPVGNQPNPLQQVNGIPNSNNVPTPNRTLVPGAPAPTGIGVPPNQTQFGELRPAPIDMPNNFPNRQ